MYAVLHSLASETANNFDRISKSYPVDTTIPRVKVSSNNMLASIFIIVSICIAVEGVTQQLSVNTKFHSYALGSYGQYNMRYKSIEASSEVRTVLNVKMDDISINHIFKVPVFHGLRYFDIADRLSNIN